MLGLLLAATIVVLVSRSLTRSLRVLRTSALDVAQRRLPQAVESMRSGGAPDVHVEPVPLHTRDEVGQVARAFDTVHGQALKLAADQAALQSNVSSMFVNLSRRSQALVERQLQLIEQLESNEQDPDQLSNLFQLDHLATRMRRNSENLLVLAGTDLAKRNVAPVPLVDVLRAAVSEIEQYQRIVVQAPPQATVVGRATSDVIHLLAELLDNATNFSPPDSQVVMSSLRAQDGSIVVEIADSGVGMLDHELTDANRRLSTPSAVDVSASRRMGLFVVGRLGARHGITVHLGGAPMGGPGGGVTASVTLPAHLVTVSGEAESGPTPRSAQARWGPRPARCPVLPERRSAAAHEPAGPARAADHARAPRRQAGRPADRPQRPAHPHSRLGAEPRFRPAAGAGGGRDRPRGRGHRRSRVRGRRHGGARRRAAPAEQRQRAASLRPTGTTTRTTCPPARMSGATPRSTTPPLRPRRSRSSRQPGRPAPMSAWTPTPGPTRPDAGERTDAGDAADERTADRSAGHLAELHRARAEAFGRRTGATSGPPVAPAASDVPDAPVESGVHAGSTRPDPDAVESTDDTQRHPRHRRPGRGAARRGAGSVDGAGPAVHRTSGNRPRRAGGGPAGRPERRAGGRRRRGAGGGRAGSGHSDGRRHTATAGR